MSTLTRKPGHIETAGEIAESAQFLGRQRKCRHSFHLDATMEGSPRQAGIQMHSL